MLLLARRACVFAVFNEVFFNFFDDGVGVGVVVAIAVRVTGGRSTQLAKLELGGPVYGCRNVIRPLPKSYGDNSMFTLSPTLMRIKFLRILPETCARTSCLFGKAPR